LLSLTCLLQLSLSQPQVHCITAYIRRQRRYRLLLAAPAAAGVVALLSAALVRFNRRFQYIMGENLQPSRAQ
jgi:hypothetical protein